MRLRAMTTGAVAAFAVGLIVIPGLASAAGHVQTVPVTLKEFKITMPAKLNAGPTTFTLTNKGKFPHDLVVVYNAHGTRFATPHVAPGATISYHTTLAPGPYVVVCNVGDGFHASQGMVAKFTVGTFDFKTGKWTA